ncbi:MAG: glycoside hydrolase family 36 protein [Bacteroidales bacterium]
MKKLLYLAIIPLLSLTACSKETKITSGDLQLHINDQMQVAYSSLNNKMQTFYSDYYTSDELIADELTFGKFKLKQIEENKDNNGIHFLLKGIYSGNGFLIEKHQKVTIPAGYPGMLLFETYYVNTGKKEATVKAWQNHKIRISPQNNDSVIWSFQPSTSCERKDWILPVESGFYQKNFLGMNNSDYGGGIPMINMWRKDGGLATGLTENTLKMISMPVKWIRYEDYATFGLLYEYDEPVAFGENDTIFTYNTFVAMHTGDFFNPLKQFSEYMQHKKGYKIAEPEPEAFEPVWCAWGYERTFTIDEVIGTLPKAKELGFKWVDVDDGYQIAEGDWETNSRFPGGDKDMRRLTDEIHKNGMKAKLWWAPLAADPGTNILKKHPELQLLTKEYIPQYISWWDSYYLSPVNPLTTEYTNDLLKRFLVTWNFDGLKMDGQHMNCCPPDYNPASKLDYPEQSIEKLPTFFENVFNVARAYKPYAVIQYCPCGTAVNFFNIPYMNQAVASDPKSSWQIRLKGKAYHAISDKIAYYADHVELSDDGNDFPTQIGIGGVLGSKFTYPKDNPNVEKSYLLTPEKEILYKKWVGIYNQKMLSKGKYLNLYDIAYDKPETHVIQKGDTMYYAFYAKEWVGDIELRGLKNIKYTVCEYTTDKMKTYTINGSNPVIKPAFKGSYLIEVYLSSPNKNHNN